VTRGYREAELRGLLAGEVGRGSYIRSATPLQPIAKFPSEVDGVIDLSQAVAPHIITEHDFDQALAAVMRDPKKLSLLTYSPPEGFPQHRLMAQQWLKRSGIEVSENDVVVTAGAQLALVTVFRALTKPGEKVMAEVINYSSLRATFQASNVEPLCLEMDKDGLLPDAFERAAKSGLSRVLYLVPSFQNPTTRNMSRGRRDEIIAIARKYDVTIIEDDVFRLLDTRAQPATFYALAPERVVHITSLSKTMAPGLRLGFVAPPLGQDRLLPKYLRSLGPRSVGLTGELARYWINSGQADEFLTRIHADLSHKRALFMEVFKGFNIQCETGAPFAWLELPEDWRGRRLAAALRSRRIAITPGNSFDLADQNNAARHVRVCFSGPQFAWNPKAAFEEIRNVIEAGEDDIFTPVA
jgi:DNA-binding transcriptional MocR family regulator